MARRIMGRKVQFFGVKYGRKPGVYNDWADCKLQIIGLSSAKWRRFSTHEEAHQYCFTGPKDEQIDSGSSVCPIPIEEDDKSVKRDLSASPDSHIDDSLDKRHEPKRYRLDTSSSNTKKDVPPESMAKIRAMLGLSTGNPSSSAGKSEPSSSTPAGTPSKQNKFPMLELSQLSAISDTSISLPKEEVRLPPIKLENSADNTLVIDDDSVTEVKSLGSTTEFAWHQLSDASLQGVPSSNKPTYKKVTLKTKPKTRPISRPSSSKAKPSSHRETYTESESDSDESIEILEKPSIDEIQMSQSTSEDFFRVGSTEEEVGVGIFWDIENVRVPRGMNPAIFVTKIRERFVDVSAKFCEKNFYVVCDVTQEPQNIMKQLFEFHVRIVHVPRLKANSSDNVIRDLMHEFVGYNKFSRVILISGDSDFSHDIHNFRRNKKCDCVLIYNEMTKPSMIKSASSAVMYKDLIREELVNQHQNQHQNQHFPHQQTNQYIRHSPNQAGHQHQRNQTGNRSKRTKTNSGGREFHRGRFFNREDLAVGSALNQPYSGSNNIANMNTNQGTASGPLPGFIPVSCSNSEVLSRAYYKKKKKEMLTPKAKQKMGRKLSGSGNISIRDY